MYKEEIEGRFTLIERFAGENVSIIVFQTPSFVTGENTAVVGCFGSGKVQDMGVGEIKNANFEASSSLTFEEEIAARKRGDIIFLEGSYRGSGLLVNESKCDFVFLSDVLAGRWRLGIKNTSVKTGFFGKLFGQKGLVLERVS